MGKFRKYTRDEKLQADQVNKSTRKLFRTWFKNKLEKGEEYADAKHAEYVAMVRASRMHDFMEMCGVGEPEQIDYDNPHVRINWLLCDPTNIMAVVNPKSRHRFYELLDEKT